MKTETEIKKHIYCLLKDGLFSNKLQSSFWTANDYAILFSEKQVDPFIYIDDDLNYCFDFISNGRYLSISISKDLIYFAYIYQDLNLKGNGKINVIKNSGNLFLKKIIDGFFKETEK